MYYIDWGMMVAVLGGFGLVSWLWIYDWWADQKKRLPRLSTDAQTAIDRILDVTLISASRNGKKPILYKTINRLWDILVNKERVDLDLIPQYLNKFLADRYILGSDQQTIDPWSGAGGINDKLRRARQDQKMENARFTLPSENEPETNQFQPVAVPLEQILDSKLDFEMIFEQGRSQGAKELREKVSKDLSAALEVARTERAGLLSQIRRLKIQRKRSKTTKPKKR